ncbi:MAG: hypothetical protein H6709_21940 [Kofleriaceae bacterium]|nr:hypothetical protein [Myxococcales bacterium]MCB9563487.1 hypothetical protein [Kofleriaceae bacterium]MCB9574747.1 hypothetical protein [Kofleriaceae bacterium]
MARLFISGTKLESLSAANKVTIDGDLMELTELGRTFRIQPAVRFLRVAGGDPDPHELVGLVKTEEDLAGMGADHMATSVIYVDTAYEVQPGFLGDPLPG